jgi:uncharacterized protein (DUF2164 family)
MAATESPVRVLGKDERQKAVEGIIAFFRTERDEKIGILAATALLEHFEQSFGAHFYNKGLEAARGVFQKALEAGDLQLDELRR